MRIQGINNQYAFRGKVYTAQNLTIRDLEKLSKGARKINAFAGLVNSDFIIYTNEGQNSLSILAKKLCPKKECTKEVRGYPSGSVMRDIDLIVETMQEAEDSFTSKVALGWVCE